MPSVTITPIMLSVIILTVITIGACGKWNNRGHNVECLYAERRLAERCLAERRLAERRFAERRFAERRFAERRGVKTSRIVVTEILPN
jgi:hypothetical protein